MASRGQSELFPGGSKPFVFAVLVYLAFVPLAYLIALEAPGRKDFPFWQYMAVTHALLCAVVAGMSKVLVSVLENWTPNSKLRAYTGHIRNFMSALAIWPLFIAVTMVISKWKGHG